ncbi:hypothetical protein BKA80DRAFT_262083 [Phyllosticta citrichinensis]
MQCAEFADVSRSLIHKTIPYSMQHAGKHTPPARRRQGSRAGPKISEWLAAGALAPHGGSAHTSISPGGPVPPALEAPTAGRKPFSRILLSP